MGQWATSGSSENMSEVPWEAAADFRPADVRVARLSDLFGTGTVRLVSEAKRKFSENHRHPLSADSVDKVGKSEVRFFRQKPIARTSGPTCALRPHQRLTQRHSVKTTVPPSKFLQRLLPARKSLERLRKRLYQHYLPILEMRTRRRCCRNPTEPPIYCECREVLWTVAWLR